jgi:hypothetical protein
MRVRPAVLLLLLVATPGRANYRQFAGFPPDPSISAKLRHAAEATPGLSRLKAEDLAISVVDLRTRRSAAAASGDGGSIRPQ